MITTCTTTRCFMLSLPKKTQRKSPKDWIVNHLIHLIQIYNPTTSSLENSSCPKKEIGIRHLFFFWNLSEPPNRKESRKHVTPENEQLSFWRALQLFFKKKSSQQLNFRPVSNLNPSSIPTSHSHHTSAPTSGIASAALLRTVLRTPRVICAAKFLLRWGLLSPTTERRYAQKMKYVHLQWDIWYMIYI